jgi:tetratricopeptide (TPR) repeat protein
MLDFCFHDAYFWLLCCPEDSPGQSDPKRVITMSKQPSTPDLQHQMDLFAPAAALKSLAYRALIRLELDQARRLTERYMSQGGTRPDYEKLMKPLSFWVGRLSELKSEVETSAHALALTWFEFESDDCRALMAPATLRAFKESVFAKIVERHQGEPTDFVLPDYPLAFFVAFGGNLENGIARLDECLANHPERAPLILGYLGDACYLAQRIGRAKLYYQLAFFKDPTEINLDHVVYPPLVACRDRLLSENMTPTAIPDAITIEMYFERYLDAPAFEDQARFVAHRDALLEEKEGLNEDSSLPDRLCFWRRALRVVEQSPERFPLEDAHLFALREKMQELHPEYFRQYMNRLSGK